MKTNRHLNEASLCKKHTFRMVILPPSQNDLPIRLLFLSQNDFPVWRGRKCPGKSFSHVKNNSVDHCVPTGIKGSGSGEMKPLLKSNCMATATGGEAWLWVDGWLGGESLFHCPTSLDTWSKLNLLTLKKLSVCHTRVLVY